MEKDGGKNEQIIHESNEKKKQKINQLSFYRNFLKKF